MGADFCFEILPLCKLNEARKAELNKLIDALTDEQLAGINETINGSGGNDEERAEFLDTLKDYVLQYEQCDDSRDTGTLFIRGCWFILSGGMTWGDEPTDSYRVLGAVNAIPGVWAKLEAWSIEDVTRQPMPSTEPPPAEVRDPKKYESVEQHGLFYWATDFGCEPQAFMVVGQAEGSDPTQAHGDCFKNFKDADEIAQKLAKGEL